MKEMVLGVIFLVCLILVAGSLEYSAYTPSFGSAVISFVSLSVMILIATVANKTAPWSGNSDEG